MVAEEVRVEIEGKGGVMDEKVLGGGKVAPGGEVFVVLPKAVQCLSTCC